MKRYMSSRGAGRSSLTMEATSTDGRGMVCFVYGGTHPHLGGVVLAAPETCAENTSGAGESTVNTWTLTLPAHKDKALAEIVAKHMVRQLGESVCVCAGVHVDFADRQEIEAFCKMAIDAADEIILAYRSDRKTCEIGTP